MDKDLSSTWRDFFVGWPQDLKRKGVVIPSYDEQIPFDDFLLGDDILIVQRPAPDAVGGRRVAIPFATIQAVKFTDPVKTEILNAAGYRGVSTQQSPRAAAPVTSRAGA